MSSWLAVSVVGGQAAVLISHLFELCLNNLVRLMSGRKALIPTREALRPLSHGNGFISVTEHAYETLSKFLSEWSLRLVGLSGRQFDGNVTHLLPPE